MRWTILTAALLLAACKSEGDRAADRYALIDESGASNAELCRAAREAERAYSLEGDEEGFRDWRSQAATDCLRAAVDAGL